MSGPPVSPASAEQLRAEVGDLADELGGCEAEMLHIVQNGGGPVPDDLREQGQRLSSEIGKRLDRLEQLDPDALPEFGDLRTRAENAARLQPGSAWDGLLRRFNERFDLPEGQGIRRVVERGDEFEAELENGREVKLGRAEHVLDPRRVEAKLGAAARFEPPYYKPMEFRTLAFGLIRAATVDETSRGDEAQETKEWLSGFLENPRAMPGEWDEWTAERGVQLDGSDERLYDVLAADEPAFWGDDGRLYVRVPRLLTFVVKTYGQRINRRELVRRLVKLGFVKPRNKEGMLAARSEDSIKSRRFMASPSRWTPEV